MTSRKRRRSLVRIECRAPLVLISPVSNWSTSLFCFENNISKVRFRAGEDDVSMVSIRSSIMEGSKETLLNLD